MIGNEYDSWAKNHYVPGDGFYGRERLSLMSWLWDDNGTLKALAISASGTVGFKYIAGGSGLTDDMLGLVWDAAADSTDVLVRDWAVPHDYKRDTGRTGERSKIIVRAKVRKLDTTGSASDNADLELNCQASWHNSSFNSNGVESDGDAAINVLASALEMRLYDGSSTAVLPTDAAADSEAAFRWLSFDVTAGMTSAQLAALLPGTPMTFKLFPNEAIGTDLNLELMDVEVVYTRHLLPADKNRTAEAHG